MTEAHRQFLNFGHTLVNSNWSAWYCAYQYASEINSNLLPLIEKGCDYAEQMKRIPEKYLRAGEELFNQAMKACKK